MPEPVATGQLEIQLGHLCNNRCVFCVSGQLTSRGEAPFLRVEDLRRALDEGWAAGRRRVTLLGGEPTIQPYFMDVVRHAVALGFEIVIFSNGSKPGRTDLIDEVAATGGSFEWRFSFQGATREAHERTTRRRGSFAQLLRSVDRARSHGHRVTVNMCVVTQNLDSVEHFPDLLVPRGVSQLHLDMVNPYDTGTATPEEIAAMMPRYSDLAAPLTRMIASFPSGFDVNIGNLPHCVAPAIAPFVHHGGEKTWTITANDHGAAELAAGRKKYALKQAFKTKPEACRSCLFDDRCSGVFDAYAERYGVSELVPVLPDDPSIDADGPLFALRAAHVLRGALRRAAPPPPFERVRVTEVSPREIEIAFVSSGLGALSISLTPPASEGPRAFATSMFAAVLRGSAFSPEAAARALAWLWRAVLAKGLTPVHPPGPDSVPETASRLPRSAAARLARLRARAPFGELAWTAAEPIPGGVELTLISPVGERIQAWCTETPEGPRAGYRVVQQDTSTAPQQGSSGGGQQGPSAALVDGVRRLLVAMGRLPEAAIARASDGASPST